MSDEKVPKGNTDQVKKLIDNVVNQGGGQLVITYNPEDEETPWLVGSIFGREAEDSPMAGGAVYGVGTSMTEALVQALEDL